MRVWTGTLFSALLLSPTVARADPGLSSLKGLIPLYIAALVICLLVFYVVPIRLVFHVRALQSEKALSRTRLFWLLSPAGLVGAVGLIDFLSPISLLSAVFFEFGPNGLYAYWIFAGLSGFMVFIVWSTCQKNKGLLAKPALE
jgi:hypothetical protein